MNKLKRPYIIFAIYILFQMTSCSKKREIKISNFKELPSNIPEYICYFAKNKVEFQQKKFICADDYKDAFMIINGEEIKFKPTGFSVTSNENLHWEKTFTSDNFQMKIDMFLVNEMDDIKQQKGTITIKSKDGIKFVTNFYGECEF